MKIKKYRKPQTIGASTVMEINTLPSETVPDQAMSIREIMTKFVQGTLDDVENDYYDYSEDLPDLRGLDITQSTEMLAMAKRQYNESKEAVHNSAKEQREIKAKIKAQQEIEDAKIVQ